jgi:integrase
LKLIQTCGEADRQAQAVLYNAWVKKFTAIKLCLSHMIIYMAWTTPPRAFPTGPPCTPMPTRRTNTYRRGYSQGFIQVILRHKSPSTTTRYMHTLGHDEVRAVLDDGLKRDAALVIPFDQSKTASGGQSRCR